MSTIDDRPGETSPTPASGSVSWTAVPAGPVPSGAYSPPAPPAPQRPSGRRRAAIAAGVLALAVAGGGTFAVVHAAGSSSSSSAAAGAPGGAVGGAVGGPGGSGGGSLGFQPTDYHLSGTITAVGSGTVTIKTSSGATTTYTVTSSTHLMRNGTTASLSAFQAGDSVVGSTTTQNGIQLNDLVSGLGSGGRGQGGTLPQQGSGTGAGNS